MTPEDEKYAQELIEKMKIQQQAFNPAQLPSRNPERINDSALSDFVPNQSILNSVQNSSPPAPAQGAFEVCSQCGTIHPPVEPGKPCPVAKLEETKQNSGITEDNVSQFVSNLRNIAISQIQAKNIKDGNKLFKHLTLSFMKSLEEYSEN